MAKAASRPPARARAAAAGAPGWRTRRAAGARREHVVGGQPGAVQPRTAGGRVPSLGPGRGPLEVFRGGRVTSPPARPDAGRAPRAQSAAGSIRLPAGLDLAEPHGPVAGADQHRAGLDQQLARRRARTVGGAAAPGRAAAARRGTVVQAPGAGVQAADQPVDGERRARPVDRGASTVDLRRQADPVGGLRQRRAASPASIPSSIATSSPAPADGEPVEQVAGGVPRGRSARSACRRPARCPGPPRARNASRR